MPKSERLLLLATAAASLVLRAVAFFRYRFDSDEPQHLHVAWGWTAGLVQYRDLFDNHAPLFHMLTAPLVALVGERATIGLWMRVPMLVLFAVVLWGTYDVAKRIWDERVALWSVVLLSLFPPFFLKSLEYRTDNLWNALWVLALVLIMRGQMFLAGLILGAAMATSLKTTLLIVTLALAGVITEVFVNRQRRFRIALPALAGFVILPAILLMYFASAGAWDAMRYCVVEFNGRVAETRPHAWIFRALYPFTLGALLFFAWRARNDVAHVWRYFVAVAIGVFTITIASFWILLSPRDFLPLMPLAAMLVASAILRGAQPVRTFAIVIAIFALGLIRYADRFENRTDEQITMLNQLLRLTRPGEPIIDIKGETVFRRRATYPIFEAITRAQMVRGLVKDTIAEDVVRARVHVAQADGPMLPAAGRAFLSAHFLDMGRLRASGQWIGEDGAFSIAVPGEYMIVNERGEARGMLDGTPYAGARELAIGAHRFERAVPREAVTVVWAPAIRRGHSPFHLRDREF